MVVLLFSVRDSPAIHQEIFNGRKRRGRFLWKAATHVSAINQLMSMILYSGEVFVGGAEEEKKCLVYHHLQKPSLGLGGGSN